MKVYIEPEESNLVERLFFEYNSTVDILKYLLSQKDMPQENISHYNVIVMEKSWELEQAKSKISSKYRPEGYNNYVFLFEENAIDFTK